ncbi:HAD-IIA family hydrolase [Solihabitans fulvus]|uniref:HAD-IIA family hydrolase n=1 Tax=Solihabitans fulvus TaxID=1892852 RepID=A0A5B2WSJ8_9PSEU|nr:HAD-IIA family hydrolase [Solihabitans fulvus]
MLDDYDALLLDLDGTVYRGGEAVPGAAEAVASAREQGVAVRFVTNNASRAPQQVAEHLSQLGFGAAVREVSTSAQAAAAVLATRVPAGSSVLVLGTEALADEVRSVGLVPVRTAEGAVAVVQGLSQDLGWRHLAEACVAIRAGAQWVACNVDATLPTERGQLPGNGALVAALRTATGVEPVVAGKPARPLMDQAVASTDATRPLVVGDRLDTDIAGARAAGLDSLLVLTGVSTPVELLAAQEELRPTHVSADLSCVLRPAAESAVGPRPQWTVLVEDGVLSAAAAGAGDSLDLLRALCAAWWAAGGGTPELRAEDGAAKAALIDLGLANS